MSEPEPSSADLRSDIELVDAINGGDTGAFETLYRRHHDWVVRLAYRFTGSNDDALDVLQETFRYLLGKFPGFRLTAKLTTFLYPAVRHLSLGLKEKKRPQSAGDDVLAAEPARESHDHGEQRRQLAEVLLTLSDLHREVVLMRFVDGFSLEEIGVALDVPTGTVKSRLHNALRILRDDPKTRRYFDQEEDS